MDKLHFVIWLIVATLIAQIFTIFLIKKRKKINEVKIHWIDAVWLTLSVVTLYLGIYRVEIEKGKEELVNNINNIDHEFDKKKIEIYEQDYYCRNFDFKRIKFDYSLNNEINNKILCKHITKIKNQIESGENKIKNFPASWSNSSEGTVYLSEIELKNLNFVGSEEIKRKYTEALKKISSFSQFDDSFSKQKIKKTDLENELNDKKKKSEYSYWWFQIIFIILFAVRSMKFTAELHIKQSKQKQEVQAENP